MRRLPSRPVIAQTTLTKLSEKRAEILQVAAGDKRKKRAREIYDASRKTKWFAPVTEALKTISGRGEFCMYCSANEPSQVEHFKPLAVFPEEALDYNNYLWSCDICNRSYKGDWFPPHSCPDDCPDNCPYDCQNNIPGEPILNPLDDNVWNFFFIEEQHGQLIPRVNPDTGEKLPRAVITCIVVGIDRDTVQIRRRDRYEELRRNALRSKSEWESGDLDVDALRGLIADWRTQASQPDVADYFLNGPGRSKEPFRSLLLAIGEVIP